MDIYSIIVSLALSAIIFKILQFLKEYKRKWDIFKNMPGPGPSAYPFIGHVMLITGKPDEYYEKVMTLLRESPDSETSEAGYVWVGTVPVVIIGGAKAAETLLHSSNHIEKSFFYNFLHSWLGTGLLTSSGQKWKSRRRLLTPTFHFSILTEFLEVMNEQANVFTDKLEPYSLTNKKFDIWNSITLCTLDIICETAMGKAIHAQNNEDSEYVRAIYKCTECILKRGTSPWLWPNIIYSITPMGRQYKKCLEVVHSFSRSVIEDRMEMQNSGTKSNKGKRMAFLDTLMQTYDNGKPLSFQDIQEEVDTFMFEGHDTTAAAISWAVYMIGLHVDVQEKIHKELDEIFEGRREANVTMEDINKMKYLDMVIKESLRIAPSVPMIGRVTSCDCTIDGHFVPAGTECLLFTQAVNQNPQYWTEPDKFDPQRFTTENCSKRHPYAYLPFSAGPRNCIGQKFANLEDKVVLAHLLRKYSIVSCDEVEDIKFMGDVILRSRDGIKVKLQRRSVK